MNPASSISFDRKEIAVEACAPAWRPLLAALERCLPIRLLFRREPDGNADGRFELTYESITSHGKVTRTFTIAAGAKTTAVPPESDRVTFSSDRFLDPSFRGATIEHKVPSTLYALDTTQANVVVLAAYADRPLWIRQQANGREIEAVAVPPPELKDQESALDHLHGGNFLALLPLYHFLKHAVISDGWMFPATRACFMFDDPNLHWPTYGYVSYEELIRRGRACNYHVSFATVPLDGWYTNPRTAALFRQHPERLSLLLHGNNHLYAELARRRTGPGHLELAAQCIRRIERIEKQTGLHVCRTMAPPHGACSNAAMDAMLSVGIEAAYISPWSLRLWDESRTWPPEFGLTPAEFVERGFAVLPRFKLSDHCEGAVRVSALLGRPLIPVGHHHDLKAGPELLDRVAGIIHRLPTVEWSNTEQLARTNFVSRLASDGETLQVHPFSTRVEIVVPPEVSRISIQHPLAERTPERNVVWQVKEGNAPWTDFDPTLPIAATPGSTLHAKLKTLGEIEPASVRESTVPLTAHLRRILCEVRDRLLPLAPRRRRGARSGK